MDLRDPIPAYITALTIVGDKAYDRMGIWMRTGDVNGDGCNDLVVASDEVDEPNQIIEHNNRGMVYVIRGGNHLAVSQTIDLSQYGSTALAGHIARFPPPGAAKYHFGSTCQIADLDGNSRGEVLASATLNRSDASLRIPDEDSQTREASGGAFRGKLYIAWDDNFPNGLWPNGYEFDISAPTLGQCTEISGGSSNISFGEEMFGGLDYDGDGMAELFVGDIVGNGANGNASGLGYVLYHAADLKNTVFSIDSPPGGVVVTTIDGPVGGAISSNTAAQGDFNGDGIFDLMVGNPHDNPQGRFHAGSMHILFGRVGGWPTCINLATGLEPPKNQIRMKRVNGAHGQNGSDLGDTLCYSAATGDVDGDGRIDLIVNEMVGNGIGPGTINVGDLLVISGPALGQIVAADLNGTGTVNMADFGLFAIEWLSTNCGLCNGADLTGNNEVGLPDLLQLATDWLICQ